MKIMSRYSHSSLFFSSFILHVYNEIYAVNIVQIISSPIIIIYSVNSRKLKKDEFDRVPFGLGPGSK